jgi:membrane protein YqaA with SNARE-associated domain
MNAWLAAISAALLAFGPWGVCALGVVDSVGVPLPAAMDVLLIGIGASSVAALRRALFAALLAVVGSTCGNAALFLAARRGVRRLGRNPVGPRKNSAFRRWFDRYGLLTVFIPALTPAPPLPLKVFVISAGALRTSFARFLAVVALARALRYFGEAYLGFALGKEAPGFLARNGWTLAGAALLVSVALAAVIRAWSGRQPAL